MTETTIEPLTRNQIRMQRWQNARRAQWASITGYTARGGPGLRVDEDFDAVSDFTMPQGGRDE